MQQRKLRQRQLQQRFREQMEKQQLERAAGGPSGGEGRGAVEPPEKHSDRATVQPELAEEACDDSLETWDMSQNSWDTLARLSSGSDVPQALATPAHGGAPQSLWLQNPRAGSCQPQDRLSAGSNPDMKRRRLEPS